MSVNKYEKEMNDILWNRITRLFGYSNTMKDNSEELTDFFIPFENDILLIEDKSKDTEFQIEEGLNCFNVDERLGSEGYSQLIKGWVNLYNSKIVKAVNQLNGAESYLKNNGIVYKNRNKVSANEIKYNSKAKVHKIILLHNIDEASKQYYDTIYGGPIYNSAIVKGVDGRYGIQDGMSESSFIFSYGFFDYNVHILSEQQFKFINIYLPTLKDIIDYLNWKEELLSNDNLMMLDEYTLVCYYIEYGYSLRENIKNEKVKNGKVCDIVLCNYDDTEILDLELNDYKFIEYRESSNCINNLLHYLEDNKQMADSEQELKERLMKFYLRLNIEEQLKLTNGIPELLNMSYDKSSAKNMVYYSNNCLYLFSNFDKRIEDLEGGNLYIEAFLAKYAVIYLEKFRDKMDIKDIIISAIHKNDDGTIRDIYASMNIEENMNNISQLKELYETLDRFLPQKVEESLHKVFVDKCGKIKGLSLKGRDRNKLCPCGSGKKYKKCCYKYL